MLAELIPIALFAAFVATLTPLSGFVAGRFSRERSLSPGAV